MNKFLRMIAIVAVIGMVLTACENPWARRHLDPLVPIPHVAVTGITDLPSVMPEGGASLSLSGTVQPANATFREINFSVENAGGTGATITGSVLNVTSGGRVHIRATITNGIAEGQDFTTTFYITIPIVVTFDTGHGEEVNSLVAVYRGTVSPPANPATSETAFNVPPMAGLWHGKSPWVYEFAGWELNGTAFNFETELTQDITLTAVWTQPVRVADVVPNNITEAVDYANDKGGKFTLAINDNIDAAPQVLNTFGVNLSLVALGDGERRITLSGNGSLFTINEGAVLNMGNNIRLQGHSGNDAALVQINNDGTFNMNGGVITGNSANNRGGVFVIGTFNMNGGVISGNTAIATASDQGGGGVFVWNGGSFTMKSGEISGNTAASIGGGVLNNGTFRMYDGEISDNTANQGGGGVFVWSSGTFTMEGGVISGNNAILGGGVMSYGIFTMSGTAEISSNDAVQGGGVYNSGTFTMNDGNILGNRVEGTYNGGGGVFNAGNFSMSGTAEISGNTANLGGGVFIYDNGTFTMNGGEISGNRANGTLAAEGGGGVLVHGGIFTMDGGGIFSNTAVYREGGGVLIGNTGAFTLKAGKISDNTAASGGGVMNRGTFNMEGGKILENRTTNNGGGVYVFQNGNFTMNNNAEISGNTANAHGGGVMASHGIFTMNNGIISDNTANFGGGVGIWSNGTFNMNNGEISGNEATTNGGGIWRLSGGIFTFTLNATVANNLPNQAYPDQP